jgi:hypothetical protein
MVGIRKTHAPQWTHLAAPKGTLELTPSLKQRLTTFFADTRGQVDGVFKTVPSIKTRSSPFIAEDGTFPDYPESMREAVKNASTVATTQYAQANGTVEGQVFWPEEIHFLNVDGKAVIAAQFKDNAWGRQSKEVITLVDMKTAKVLAMTTDGDWHTPPFSQLPQK